MAEGAAQIPLSAEPDPLAKSVPETMDGKWGIATNVSRILGHIVYSRVFI